MTSAVYHVTRPIYLMLQSPDPDPDMHFRGRFMIHRYSYVRKLRKIWSGISVRENYLVNRFHWDNLLKPAAVLLWHDWVDENKRGCVCFFSRAEEGNVGMRSGRRCESFHQNPQWRFHTHTNTHTHTLITSHNSIKVSLGCKPCFVTSKHFHNSWAGDSGIERRTKMSAL